MTHVLLTVLGKDARPARYALAGCEFEARLAPVALLNLLPERPEEVVALCTPEAKRESLPLLESEVGGGTRVRAVDVPAGSEQKDIDGFLNAVVGAFSENGEGIKLTVDVTHGFRHFSFLTYIAVLYLNALQGTKICGAHYGLLSRDGPSPFLDLRPLLKLPRWIHALEVMRDTGSTLPMAQQIRPLASPWAREGAGTLKKLSRAYLSGLPLELGWQAQKFQNEHRKPLRKLLEGDQVPLANKVVEHLAQMLEPFKLPSPPQPGEGWKAHVCLTELELRRQASLIDNLRKTGNQVTALGLMREWVVSWVMWRCEPGHDWLRWLERGARTKAEQLLRVFKDIGGDHDLGGDLTDEQRDLGAFWGRLAEVRNAYAHHGMRGDDLVSKSSSASERDVCRYWKDTLREIPRFSLALGDSRRGRILVSPIGMRPGVLFSALHACRTRGEGVEPTLCLIVCSPQTEAMIGDVCDRARFTGRVEPLPIDPFGDATVLKSLAKRARRHFIGATEVLVNVTGGTTFMGLAAEALGRSAGELACPVRRFGLIDRRPSDQQEADPYQIGEPFWLDADEEGDGDRR